MDLVQFSAVRIDVVDEDAEVDAALDLNQNLMPEDADNLSRKKRKLLYAMKLGQQKKKEMVNILQKRKKDIDAAKSSA